MLTFSDLTYRIAGRTLLDQASAQINAGWKVGLIGRNGSGKSTLLDLIRGELQPDGGEVRLQNGVRLGFLAQEAPGGAQTPLDAVLAADEERASLLAAVEAGADGADAAEIHERLRALSAHAAPARAAAILAGLGFAHEAQQRPLSSFSGGWRMRVALAAALFAEPDLLLLDEPTNHLDLEAALWLGDFLKRYRRTLLLVSHDRQFIDEVADHILHLAERRLTLYTGGYETFLRTRRETLSRQQALAQKQETQRKHLQAFVDRFRAKASKASQAQSRLKMLARLEPVTLAEAEAPVRFDFPEPAELAPPLLTLDNVAVGYAPGKPVLRRLDLRLDPDDRIALLGANGNGKSTLVKLIAGRLEPMQGNVTRAANLKVAYFAQHQLDELDPEDSPYDHVRELMPDAPEAQVRARVGAIGFSGEAGNNAVKNLSGGEKARLLLALATFEAPHLIILDEPTNHLDIDSRAALIEAINDYPGAVILVSHDRYLLEACADRLWLVADGRVTPFDGDLDDYVKFVLSERGGKSASEKAAPQSDRAQARKAAADKRVETAPLRKRVQKAEADIARLTRELEKLDLTLADGSLFTRDAGKAAAIAKSRADTAAALAAAEEEWLDASHALESA